MDNTYLVAGNRPWNTRIFNQVICHYPGKWLFVRNQSELTLSFLAEMNPRYIFFLHWSWIVPESIFKKYECVCFHMAEVPYGRGGSPLQNLIVRGHHQTILTALQMTSQVDAGPIYLKEPLSLEGNAEEIYIRATFLSAHMIKRIIEEQPKTVPQVGEIVVFERRRPEQSVIPECHSLESLYDFIRMLDAEDYPRAFLNYHGFRYEFNRATLYNGRIHADVQITPLENDIP